MPAPRNSRIELRASEADRALIIRAAEASDVKLNEFAVSRLVSESRRVLADRREFVLSADAWAEWERINARAARDVPSLHRLLERPTPFV